jgi:hypothetical protein
MYWQALRISKRLCYFSLDKATGGRDRKNRDILALPDPISPKKLLGKCI